jgi:hypothetical protein
MANTTLTPNMSLVVPTVAVDPGPDWANNVNASLSIIDGHNHSSGSGAPISVDGLSITTDLPFNGNSATELKSAQFQSQGAVLPGATVDALYVVNNELFYNDAAGNNVQITLNGSVTGAAGTITGLPSGTASASYNLGTFSFKSATNTPANMSVGPIVTGANMVNPKFVTISASGAQPNDYSLVWPLALPTSGTRYVTATTGGQFDYGSVVAEQGGILPIGAVVGTFPNLAGTYVCTATTAADSVGYVKCNGQTIVDATSPMNGVVIPNINNSIFLMGSTTAGSSGGNNNTTLTTTQLPVHDHGAGTYTTSLSGTFASSGHNHNFAHSHAAAYFSNSAGGGAGYFKDSIGNSTTTIDTGNTVMFQQNNSFAAGGQGGLQIAGTSAGTKYTSGVSSSDGGGSGSGAVTGGASATASLGGSNSVTGTSASAGTGSAYDSRPAYISAVYCMRIK